MYGGAKDRAELIKLSRSEQAMQIGLIKAENEYSDQSWAVSRAECRKQSWGGLEEIIVAEESEQVKKNEGGQSGSRRLDISGMERAV